MALDFGVLGPLVVWSDGEAVAVSGAKRRGLLAFLLAHAGEPQPLDRIVDALWSGSPSRGAESTVQTYVSQLRKLFAAHGLQLVHRAGGYVLDLDANALDASRFEAAVSAASAVEDRDQRLALLDEALDLWRGAPLDEFAGQAWADERARQWTRMHVLAYQLRAQALLDAGRHRDALPTLEQLVAAHPLHEPFWAQLVVARYRCGQQVDALAAVTEARKVLATELGIDPGPELVELENEVLNQDPALDAPTDQEAASTDVVRTVTVVEPLPDGVVTFLLTDIEGSTALWDQHPEQMAKALVRHEDVIADVVQSHNGRLLKSRGEGDATLSVFLKATDAVAAAVALQRRLSNEPWPGGLDLATRVALHTGEAHLRDGDYYGGTLNRAARIRGVAAGGQVLVSRAVHDVVVDVLPAELELIGFGAHELKGLQRAENVYAIAGPGLEVVVSERPAQVIARPRTSFIARDDLVHEIERALRGPGVVTLIGTGGIGKTRLALETATRVRDQFDAVHVVPLAEVADPDAIVAEIANAIGVTASTDTIEGIVLALGRERVLIVVDNCEHLIDACAEVIDDLTANLSALRVLATSRVPLELPGERVVAVEPLPEADAVKLLCDRGGRRAPEPGSVERDSLREIARRLDGIPLALELTGARLRSMSAADLVARLPVLDATAKRPATDRHATMRTALDWSYDLLSEQERALLRRLSVFAGFTLDAAEHVVPGGEGGILSDRTHIGDLLDQLVLDSLVVFDSRPGRYRLLEPVRQYAAELLETEAEAVETRDRHAQYFTEAAERVGRAMAAGEQSRTELDSDEGNLEAALSWSETQGDDNALCRTVAALGFFWFSTNTEQGLRWTRRAVERPRRVSASLWAAVLASAGQLGQSRRGVDPATADWLEEAIAIYRRLERPRALAYALMWRGRLHFNEGRPALKDFEEALATFRAADDGMGIAHALSFLRLVAWEEGDERLSEVVSAELHDVAATRAPQLLGLVLDRDALVAFDKGDYANALRYIVAAEEHQRGGDRFNLVGVLLSRAWIELRAGSRHRALEALREALELDRKIGGTEDLGAMLVAAGALIDAEFVAEAHEVLLAADAVHGSAFGPLPDRHAREKAKYIEQRLDLTQPTTQRFANVAEAGDWVLQWIEEQLKSCAEDTERDDEIPHPASRPVPPLPSIIGRGDVLTLLDDTLSRARMFTLVGPGGIGKTRLLEEAYARFGDRFERVWRVDLVAARDRAAVESALADALLPARDPMMKSPESDGTTDVIAEVASRFSARRSLLALDNCEQLLDVVPEIVETLVHHAPSLTVLATSREPLGARGEVVVPVAPLELPPAGVAADPVRLQQVESVQLLLTRARERGADVAVTTETADDIASICRQLDGIPLGLELAAARLASTSVRDLAARLSRQLELLSGRGTDPRHRTMRNAIEWSYDLLEPAQQVLLRRLGIFVGGFTLEAAEEVCSGDASDALPPGDAVYLNLSELVSKSLVIFEREQGRYRMLEPIRQFARHSLDDSVDAVPVATAHAGWVLRLSREVLRGAFAGDGRATDDFAVELDNVHSALDWLYDHGDFATYMRIVAASGHAWSLTDWRRGRAAAERAVALTANTPVRLRAAVLLSYGIVESRADLAGSAPSLAEARSLYAELGDEFGLSWSTFYLGRAYEAIDYDEAERLMLEAAALFDRLQLDVGESWARTVLGVIASQQRKYEKAKDHLEQALTVARRTGENSIIGVALAELGVNAQLRGDLTSARQYGQQAVELIRHGGDPWNSVGVFSQDAWAEAASGQLEAAERLLHHALRLALELDDEWQLREALVIYALVKAKDKHLDEARALLDSALGNAEALPTFVSVPVGAMIAAVLRDVRQLLGPTPDERTNASPAPTPFDAARRILAD